MPKMKYFQQIANVRNRNLEVIYNLSGVYGEEWVNLYKKRYSAEIFLDIVDDYNTVNYMLGCQHGMVLLNTYNITEQYTVIEAKKDYIKPSKEMIKNAFTRQLEFINHLPKSNIGKDIKCAAYYLEKINDDIWYDKLPKKILTYNHKYPNDPISSYRVTDHEEEQEDDIDLD